MKLFFLCVYVLSDNEELSYLFPFPTWSRFDKGLFGLALANPLYLGCGVSGEKERAGEFATLSLLTLGMKERYRTLRGWGPT